MANQRIGELLSRIVPLSGHDVDEVLHEQAIMHARGEHKRFGGIALALGLCRPEHVWRAWCAQLGDAPRPIDLDAFGIDTQATAFISAATARRFNVIPVRIFADFLIVAAEREDAIDVAELSALTGKQVRLVRADPHALRRAIDTYYPVLQAAG